MSKTNPKIKAGDAAAGMDCLPEETAAVAEIAATADAIARFYGFERMRLSPVEDAAVWAPLARAGLLDGRPPVFCKARSGEEMMLPVSAALGMARAYFSHRMQDLPHPLKLAAEAATYAPLAGKEKETSRGEKKPEGGEDARPAPFGVRREWALTMIGEDSLVAEAQIIQVIWKACAELGIAYDAAELKINATGCNQCRGQFRTALAAFFRSRTPRLCPASRRDLKARPARILACEDERCRGIAATAPSVLDFLCERCKKQLRTLLEFLDEAHIPYFLDAGLFGEGAWFSEIVFIVTMRQQSPVAGEGENASIQNEDGHVFRRDQAIIAEGGRMSRVAQAFGGKDVALASGTLFLDVVAQEMRRLSGVASVETDVFFIQLGELAKRKSLDILEALREAAVDVKESLGRDSIKIQLKIAERVGARYALVLGQKEALDTTIIVREMVSGIQETVAQEKLADFLAKKLKK